MLDLKFIRENKETLEDMLVKRGINLKLTELYELDYNRRKFLKQIEELRAVRNKKSDLIGKLKKEGREVTELIEEMKKVSERIKKLGEDLNNIEGKLFNFLLTIPNIPHNSVPVGIDSNDNLEIRKVGEKPNFPLSPSLIGKLVKNWGY